MPARELRWESLSAEDRDQVTRALAVSPILAEPGSASGRWWWALLALLGAGVLAGAVLGELGVVSGAYDKVGILALPSYALGTLLLVRGALGAIAARVPFRPTLALYPYGVVDARTPRIRVLPIADFEKVVIHRDPGNAATYFRIEIHFRGEPPETFRLFGFEKNLPHAALEALGKGVAAPLPAGQEAGPPPRKRPWLMSLIAGVAVAAGADVWLLPVRSMATAASPDHWRAIERAFPFGWVETRGEAVIHAQYEAGRAAIESPVYRRLLDELERRGDPRVALICVGPPPAQLDAASAWLKQQAGGAEVAPVTVHYASSGGVPGEEIMERKLSEALEARIPRALLRLERWHESFPQDLPRIVVSFDVTPSQLYQFEGGKRLFAGLDFTYAASLVIGKDPPLPLATGVRVAAPEKITVGRLKFEGDTLAPIGESGIPQEDMLVYTEQVTTAAANAAPELAAKLFPEEK